MKHPPYHLRPNKAIDRLIFIELIARLSKTWNLSRYSYYGLGGPFLEDIRQLSQRFPELRYVSIEKNEDTYRRQQFHRCTKKLTLIHSHLNTFLKHRFESGQRCIAWLDYNDLRPDRIEEFAEFLGMVGAPSIVRVSVKADVDRSAIDSARRLLSDEVASLLRAAWLDDFQRKYNDYLPGKVTMDDLLPTQIPSVVQSMIQVAAQRVLPELGGTVFQFAHSCTYADGPHQMTSVTGVVCDVSERQSIHDALGSWTHGRTDWRSPEWIDVPVLSVKERLRLEKLLPAPRASADRLAEALGYKVDDSQGSSARKLKQYKDYYRFYPLFARIGV